MKDKELFETILTRIQEQNARIKIDFPYEDTYFTVYVNDEFVGEMNYGAHTLTYNLMKLGQILNTEKVKQLFIWG